ncbi:MAG: 23S rRNA (uracil(1939)-C(5))-methyltransferase RlmD [Terracidiphilus sp.]
MKPTNQKLLTPERLLTIEKPIYGGAFLARDEGKAVFVPLTLPGEQARVRIVEDKRSHAVAEAEEIVAPSPDRIMAACPHFGVCGGCNYQHATYEAQLGLKQAILRETLERAGVGAPERIDLLYGEPWGYRNRIRLALDANGYPGYRGRRSHDIVPIAECLIAAPLLVRAALAVGEIMRKLAPGARVNEVSLFCDRDETRLLAGFFSSGAARFSLEKVCGGLAAQIPQLASAELSAGGHDGKPGRTVARWGAESLIYNAAGFGYRVDPGAFFQVNRWLVDEFVDRVTEGQTGSLAWDLFAGVGLFARRLAGRFGRVVAVESSPASTSALIENLSGTTASAVKSTTLDFLRRAQKAQRPDLIVLDPPRAGLDAESGKLLAKVAAPLVVYVSCDPATLARDLRALVASGYAIESLTLADLFPQTFHLESIVRLRR